MNLPYVQNGDILTDTKDNRIYEVNHVRSMITCLIIEAYDDEQEKTTIVINAINAHRFSVNKPVP